MAGFRVGGVAQVIGVAVAAGLAAGPARADRITLRGGGQIKGVVLPSKGRTGEVLVLTETLTRPLKYRKEQIVDVAPEATPLIEYLGRRDDAKETAESQFDLGLWCEEHRLPAFASLHYRKAVELDKTYGPAHKKLGHVEYGGQWLTVDELRAAQGLVKFKGRWMSPEARAKAEEEETAAARRGSWARRLGVLKKKLLSDDPRSRKEAEDQLAAIDDPDAVAPLVKLFGGGEADLRIVLARTLGGIEGKAASSALLGRLLAEDDSAVREATMDEVAKRPREETVPALVKALKPPDPRRGTSDPRLINRAAWALGNLKAVSAVPRLVSSLIVEHEQVVLAPADAPPNPGGGGLGVGFGAGPGGAGAVGMSYGGGSFVSGTVYPWGMLTGPVVGPGVVAYGAVGYPGFGAAVPVAPGLGMPDAIRQPQPRLMRSLVRNGEVLNALVKLTGQDFGFDVDAWKQWVATSFRPDPEPARRVPQP